MWRTDVGAFGATLSLRVPGHDDIHLASGVDDRDPDTPMPTDGTFLIGTSTRTFVAAAALQLVDEGRLSLDEPVEPWLGAAPHAARDRCVGEYVDDAQLQKHSLAGHVGL